MKRVDFESRKKNDPILLIRKRMENHMSFRRKVATLLFYAVVTWLVLIAGLFIGAWVFP